MILSVSRRTDIPAFFTDWFFNRLKAGYVLVRNPMNYHQVSRVELNPDIIDCIVFWTKDPTNIIDKLDKLKDYKYYFHITATNYDPVMERNVDPKKVIKSIQRLSSIIGKEKIIWRYDPIILTDNMDIEFHRNNFSYMAKELANYTEVSYIGFLHLYKKSVKNMKEIRRVNIKESDMLEISSMLKDIGEKHNINVKACSEEFDITKVGMERANCVDNKLISEILGENIKGPKDKSQRKVCNCIISVDIGAYNSCSHGCLYCYANYSDSVVRNNLINHDPNSPMLIGNIEPEDKIIIRKMERYRDNQLSFW